MQVSDGHGGTDTQDVSITIYGTNDDRGNNGDDGNNSEETRLIINVTPHSEVNAKTEFNEITQVNGGSGEDNGFDVKNGVIVKIGDNVRIWLNAGDPVPEHKSEWQIEEYSKNNTKAGNKDNYTDVFVFNDNTGYEHVMGTQGTKTNVKDYIFISGDKEHYSVDATKNSGNPINNMTGITITHDGQTLTNGSGHVAGIILADGSSKYFDGNPEPTTTYTTKIMLDIDIRLVSEGNAKSLTSVTLSGIPEGATFVTGNGLSSASPLTNGKYTLTFDEGVHEYKGEMTIVLPGNNTPLGTITMSVGDTVSEGHKTEFQFDGSKAASYDSLNPPENDPSDDPSSLKMAANFAHSASSLIDEGHLDLSHVEKTETTSISTTSNNASASILSFSDLLHEANGSQPLADLIKTQEPANVSLNNLSHVPAEGGSGVSDPAQIGNIAQHVEDYTLEHVSEI